MKSIIITASILVSVLVISSCTAVVNPPVEPTTNTTTTTQTDRSIYGSPTTTSETRTIRRY